MSSRFEPSEEAAAARYMDGLSQAFAEATASGNFELAERFATLAFGLFARRRAGWVNERRTQ
jgi:hypothetical protein